MSEKKETVLVLRTCRADMTARGRFKWPKRGPVRCPDWDPEPRCGGGLHGLLWGTGDASLLDWSSDARWVVVEVVAADVVDLHGKIKFPRGVVRFAGERKGATDLIMQRAPPGTAVAGAFVTAGCRGTATAGVRGTATAGAEGTATAGVRGTATAGVRGTATAGAEGTATAGAEGTATAGDWGTATAGDRGTATAGVRGTATAGYLGTATAGYRGTATAGDWGTATAGDWGTATAGYRGTATAGVRGTATAGAEGTATAGYRGTATAGVRGTATAGAEGTATAGDRGTAAAGYLGTATAGEGGMVRVDWYDTRRRTAVGYIGETLDEGGAVLVAGRAYRLNSKHAWVEAGQQGGNTK